MLNFCVFLSRLLSFLCKSNKNHDFIRSFVYDLVLSARHTMPLLFQNLVLLCVRIWPEPFNWPCYLSSVSQSNDFEQNARSNPVLCSLIYVVRESIVKNNAQIDAQSIAQSHSNPIVNYSEFSAYYIYVSLKEFKNIFNFLVIMHNYVK